MNALNDHLTHLPHGPEFRFLDEITHLDPGVDGEARYHITGNEAFLAGHFPSQPLWPGVIMAEAIAQLGGIIAQSDPSGESLKQLKLTAIKNMKIIGSAKPGATLTVQAKIEGRMGKIIQLSGAVLARGTVIAKGIVLLSGEK